MSRPLRHTIKDVPAPSPELTTRVGLSLTYDEVDVNSILTWVRQGAGPHITPEGMAGDGYEARYLATASLPAWLTSVGGELTLHASALVEQGPRHATRDVIASVCENDATADPKLELAVIADPETTVTLPNIQARVKTSGGVQTKNLGRNTWKYRFRFPELDDSGNGARPQGLLFLDADTILITAHYEDTVSRVFKCRVRDGKVLGQFDFPLLNHHVASIARRDSDGSIWFGDFAEEELLQVDLDNSFASGNADILLTYDMSAISGFGAIEWVNVGGTDYLLAQEFITSGTPEVYVVDSADITDSGVFALGDRFKRFVTETRMQGITFHDGKLWAILNRTAADSIALDNPGRVFRYDIVDAINNELDDATINTEIDIPAAGPLIEDIDFDSQGEMWTMTEGLGTTGSDDGWLAAWSSLLDSNPVENHYTLHWDGTDTVTIKINNQLFEEMAWTPDPTPAAVSIGGPPAAAAGQLNGFFIGRVRDVVIQDSALTFLGYSAAVTGAHEANTLTTYSVTITNPGAETGDATGWTAEVGSLGIRSSNPAPVEGSNYFFGGPNVLTTVRQRFDLLTVTGLTGTELDALTMWGRVEWQQASFAVADEAALGLRYLDVSFVQQVQTLSASIASEPEKTFFKRGQGVNKPANARHVDIIQEYNRNSGTNSDGYVDVITLNLYAQ